MDKVLPQDHPDCAGGIVWSACELRWINAKLEQQAERIKELAAENESIRTLMNSYNLGGWTDSLALIKERDELAAQVEALREKAETITPQPASCPRCADWSNSADMCQEAIRYQADQLEKITDCSVTNKPKLWMWTDSSCCLRFTFKECEAPRGSTAYYTAPTTCNCDALALRIQQFDRHVSAIAHHVHAVCAGVDIDPAEEGSTAQAIIAKFDALQARCAELEKELKQHCSCRWVDEKQVEFCDHHSVAEALLDECESVLLDCDASIDQGRGLPASVPELLAKLKNRGSA